MQIDSPDIYNTEKRNRILGNIDKAMPSGSGFDDEWHYRFTTPTRVRCSSSYHAMDENGMYDAWVDFNVLLDIKDPEYGRITFPKHSTYYAKKHNLRQYFEDTIWGSLWDMFGAEPIPPMSEEEWDKHPI